MLLQILLYAWIAWIFLGIAITTLTIGKHRKPVTPALALAVTLIGLAQAVVLSTVLLRL